MLFNLGGWVGGVLLLVPLVVFGLAWARVSRSYDRGQIQRRQRLFYLMALTLGSISTVSYLGYWSWRVCQMYNAALPRSVLLALDHAISASKLVSIVAVGCFLIGRGPYRVLLLLATPWVTVQLWLHGSVLHWA